MNKNAIKKFAIDARNKLIASVTDKAGMLGITPDNCSEAITKGADFEVYKTAAGTEVTLNKKQCEQRRKLVDQIHARGFEAVVEEVAYTWFNRICAIRFMEVNDYMYPVRVRVLSSEKEGKNEPDVVTMAPDIDWDFTDKEREEIIDAKMNNRLDDLFRMLFIKQCNLLHEVLPGLFEETEDYTEMLLNISFTNEDDVIRMLIDEKRGIPEEDFNVNTIGEDGQPTGQVEIIGWLYQYYNTELKDDTFAKLKKNVKITKERIPAATQLFTPDWIVRYMVENSVGRIWIEHLRAVDPSTDEKATAEKFGWKYYLPEAGQEGNVNLELVKIRKDYIDLKPEDITCIDPCMGSGHILVAMFDILMDIYENAGYDRRDAAFKIVEKNIHGLDIDKRAYQLAYFAVMMKGRTYNRRFLSQKNSIIPKVYCFEDSNNINLKHLQYFGLSMGVQSREKAKGQIEYLLSTFKNAKEFGSLLKISINNYSLIKEFIRDMTQEQQISLDSYGCDETQNRIEQIVDIAEMISSKYYSVVTNPPYMGGNGMNDLLANYVKEVYADSKYDLFSCCIDKFVFDIYKNGFVAMITMESWMFLSSFEKLRKKICNNTSAINMVHMPYIGKGGTSLGINFGTIAFVLRGTKVRQYKATYDYIRYYETNDNGVPKDFPVINERYVSTNFEKFEMIPGTPIAYWINDGIINAFRNGEVLKKVGDTRQGMATSDNNRFLKLWFEVDCRKIGFGYKNAEDAEASHKKWFPYNKGGAYRKWYGNNDYVINYENDGEEVKDYAASLYKSASRTIKSMSEYFKPCISWSKVTTVDSAFRYYPQGYIFDVAGCCIFYKDSRKMLYHFGFLNSVVCKEILKILSPTMNYEAGHIASMPILYSEEYQEQIIECVKENILIEREDWNSFETSWDFLKHPLVKKCKYISEAYKEWENSCTNRFDRVKKNEERINSLFKKIYGLEEDKNLGEENRITINLANINRDIKSFISYAVGCMFGRYSLSHDGVRNMDQIHIDNNRFLDQDNIIPITDEEYFHDDIVECFVKFIKELYGEESLEDNLSFIADALENKGNTSREVIRNYFINDFFKDHCATYSVAGSGKRPIYWLFDSGKQNGFKALIYMHRYDADTVGRVRTDYLHRAQKYVETAMQSAQYTIDNATSASEKSKATKAVTKYTKQLAEMKIYDEAIAHVANQRIEIDLDDGVKVNYAKFQGVEVAQEGKKALKVDLLAKI